MVVPTAQNAIVVSEVGKPVHLTTRPIPTPAAGEILVKVTTAALNPYDAHVRNMGLYTAHRLPVVLVNDFSGIVAAIGAPDSSAPAPADVQIGDHVFGQTNYLKDTSDQCGMQEYAILDAYTVAKVPEGFTSNDAASLVTNVVSPFWAIFGAHGLDLPFPFPGTEHAGKDYSKHTIAIIGAGSNCGKYAVQMCAAAGFGRIVVTANKAKNEQVLKEYGATHVVDRAGTDEEVEARIRDIVGDSLVYALDCVNLNHNLGLSILSTTTKGTLATLCPGFQNDFKFAEKSAGYEERFVQGQSHNQPELGKRFWSAIPGWITEGKLRSTGWTTIEGLDADKVNKVLDDYGVGEVKKQVHVYVHGKQAAKLA